MPYTTFSTVQSIINKVSQDIRQQLSAAGAPGQTILVDYTNRIHKQMLRFSRWGFLLSEPQYFMTIFGQTDYWIGPLGTGPNNTVDTGLNLSNVDKIKNDEVRDFSNNKLLMGLDKQPLGPTLNFRSGQMRPDQPRVFYQDWNDPNILHIWPPSDNSNTYQPQPEPPILTFAPGGSLAQRTYIVRTTFVDSIGGESTGSSTFQTITIPANNLVTVKSPVLFFTANASQVQYGFWNIYASQESTLGGDTEGSETQQNVSPIAIGTNFTEPSTGLINSGKSVPTASTLAQMEGFVIGFRYFKVRADLTTTGQSLQTPNDYDDIIVQGIQYLAYKLLGKEMEANVSQQAYKAGLTEMVMDKNLFPNVDFIRPDAGTFVNQQIIGYLPPFF